MTCIIIDDEPLAREGLQSQIEELSQLQILGKFSSALTAMDFLKIHSVDLIFLDIQMPKVTGLEFAEQVSKETLIIFTTAYSQYSLKSYEFDAIDYLLKPIDKNRLEKAIKKAVIYYNLLAESTIKNIIEGSTDDFLFIKSDRKYYRVKFQDIRFIEGLKDYVVIYTQDQKLITAMNLKTIHQKISSKSFLRVSKSYVVNTDYINSFDNHSIYIKEFEIPLGEVFKDEFFRIYSGESLN